MTLWVPEVGGQVDPDSEAHEIGMGLFGGMAKGERNRVKTRTKTSMHELAATTDRHLGGRPPYGYALADAGPHPNRSKAAAGQRAHRLEPDPVTAPHVGRIFDLYVAGDGFRAIAQRLTDDGIPSPSAYDPARNTHRDPRGWSHGTVRAEIAAVARPARPFTAREIAALIEELGGIASALAEATDDERGALYTTMGLRLEFQPQAQVVSATADLSRVAGRVRRGT
ncbi:recombinase family protein [Cellulomonas sp. HD19AZ1]|uniref:recombinase family protein n=1 Tax=Cellulomonas sp. HD19AZ1 TaxID=2559593 RepID=UPI00197E5726|nr:recombinase family protein [Cellulomonas sp. HD19AZ1]